jgi:hypothetical protein
MEMQTQITKQIIETKAPNSFSFRWGKTGDDAKIYFEDERDLVKKIEGVFKAIEVVREFRGDTND